MPFSELMGWSKYLKRKGGEEETDWSDPNVISSVFNLG